MPEEALQEMVMNAQIMGEAAAQGALPHGEMPGGLPGDNFVLLDFVGEVDAEGEDPRAIEGAPVADDATPMLVESDDYEDEDEGDDVEEVGISMSHLVWSALKHVRSRRCQFVSCVIWSTVSGEVPTLWRKVRRMNWIEKPS
jgi:hypothetical protein